MVKYNVLGKEYSGAPLACIARVERDDTRAETRFRRFFPRNGRVHLNRWGEGGQFSRLLAAEVCASA